MSGWRILIRQQWRYWYKNNIQFCSAPSLEHRHARPVGDPRLSQWLECARKLPNLWGLRPLAITMVLFLINKFKFHCIEKYLQTIYMQRQQKIQTQTLWVVLKPKQDKYLVVVPVLMDYVRDWLIIIINWQLIAYLSRYQGDTVYEKSLNLSPETVNP